MNEVLSKLSSYNLLNYLLPGAIFSVLAEQMEVLNSPNEIVQQLVWYYFIGMVISRLGSIIVEPLLTRFRFVQHSSYGDYLVASKSDPKLETMVEVSNTYRTIATACLVLLVLSAYVSMSDMLGIDTSSQAMVAITSLLVLFLFSFRKQVEFVVKRVKHKTGETK